MNLFVGFLKKNQNIFFLLVITTIGGFFRFYNLNWGNPFYFHPDERNIASSVIQLNFPIQMNPHFFAYGSFPIYIIYFTTYLVNLFTKSQLLFDQAITIGRFYSAILATLLIPSVYLLGKKLAGKKVGLLTATFCALNVGLVQFAHFGTFEMWLTFLGVWLFYFSLNLIQQIKLETIFIIGIIYGFFVATKISSLPILAIPVISIFLNYISKIKSFKLLGYILFLTIVKTIIIACVSLIVFIITSPYIVLDFPSFLSSIKYESFVALGNLPVFYTSEFFSFIPIVFQFTKIYPFLLNPILTIIFIPSFLYLTFKGIKTKNLKYLLLNTCYLILFFPQAFLFAKWTRYMAPTLPFMHLIIAIALINLFGLRKNLYYKYIGIFVVTIWSFVFVLSYFVTSHVRMDTRIEASHWVKENIPTNSNTISEIYDMGIVPFNQYLRNISLLNFYDLDRIPDIKSSELESFLSKSEYIILPSQRILKTRLLNENKFPVGNKFYTNLFNGQLGFKKIYETPCDIFCKITYLGNPVFSFEETASVFDRPTVFIFKKMR